MRILALVFALLLVPVLAPAQAFDLGYADSGGSAALAAALDFSLHSPSGDGASVHAGPAVFVDPREGGHVFAGGGPRVAYLFLDNVEAFVTADLGVFKRRDMGVMMQGMVPTASSAPHSSALMYDTDLMFARRYGTGFDFSASSGAFLRFALYRLQTNTLRDTYVTVGIGKSF